MARLRLLARMAMLLASWTLVLPAHLAFAGPPTAEKPVISDIALSEGGVLQGQLLTTGGKPMPAHEISITQAGQNVVVRARTDEQGNFTVANLRGGVYQIGIGQAVAVVRLWSPRTAPPSAAEKMLLVDGSQGIARGQQPICDLLTNPLVIGLVVAAAIAIPVAIHNADNDSPSGS